MRIKSTLQYWSHRLETRSSQCLVIQRFLFLSLGFKPQQQALPVRFTSRYSIKCKLHFEKTKPKRHRNNTNSIFFSQKPKQAHILSCQTQTTNTDTHKQRHWFDLNESTLSCGVSQTISHCKHNKYRQLDGSCLLISAFPVLHFHR